MTSTAIQGRTPKELGYRMPAEWEPHEGTWLSWPKDDVTFPGRAIEAVEAVYAKAIKALQTREKIFLLVDDAKHEEIVKGKLSDHGAHTHNVSFHRIESVDVWCRDYAPTFVKNAHGKIAAVKWEFNAWGGKYPALLNDHEAGLSIAHASGAPMFQPDMIMEGGAIDANGHGALLTTSQCLLNKNRNPRMNKQQIEHMLKEYTGSEQVVWLKDGVEGDDTDGHVDDIARFSSKNVILLASESDRKDAHNFKVLKENAEILRKARNAEGGRFEIVELPMPDPIVFPKRPFAGARIPASYANFYVGNAAVIAPVFGCPTDDEALDVLKDAFPSRVIVPVYSVPFVYGAGAIHCATQQQPAQKR